MPCVGSVDTPMLRWAADLFKGENTVEATVETGAGCIHWEGSQGRKRWPR